MDLKGPIKMKSHSERNLFSLWFYIAIGLVIRESGIQKATLIFSVITILINELINSAIEKCRKIFEIDALI